MSKPIRANTEDTLILPGLTHQSGVLGMPKPLVETPGNAQIARGLKADRQAAMLGASVREGEPARLSGHCRAIVVFNVATMPPRDTVCADAASESASTATLAINEIIGFVRPPLRLATRRLLLALLDNPQGRAGEERSKQDPQDRPGARQGRSGSTARRDGFRPRPLLTRAHALL